MKLLFFVCVCVWVFEMISVGGLGTRYFCFSPFLHIFVWIRKEMLFFLFVFTYSERGMIKKVERCKMGEWKVKKTKTKQREGRWNQLMFGWRRLAGSKGGVLLSLCKLLAPWQPRNRGICKSLECSNLVLQLLINDS